MPHLIKAEEVELPQLIDAKIVGIMSAVPGLEDKTTPDSILSASFETAAGPSLRAFTTAHRVGSESALNVVSITVSKLAISQN